MVRVRARSPGRTRTLVPTASLPRREGDPLTDPRRLLCHRLDTEPCAALQALGSCTMAVRRRSA